MTEITKQLPIKLPVFETIRLGFEKIKGTKGAIWGAFLTIFLIGLGIQIIAQLISHFSILLSLIVSNTGQLINFLLTTGIVYIGMQRALDLPISYEQIFRIWELKRALNIIGLYLLKAIIFAAFIIPIIFIVPFMVVFHLMALLLVPIIAILIYLAIRMAFAIAFVLDKDVNPWRAIVLSFQATRGNVWRLIGFMVTLFFLFLISMIPLGVGLIWTVPMMFICYGLAYKALLLNIYSE